MRQVKFGNIFDVSLTEDKNVSQFIVHGCNAQGVMGSGIAKEVKQRYPEAFKAYYDFVINWNSHNSRTLGIHSILGQIIPVQISPNLFIFNAITQDNFGRDNTTRYVSYKAVKTAFDEIAHHAHGLGAEVHYPLIGAGLGGGDWAIISDIIDSSFEQYPGIKRTLWIYE